MTTRQRGTVLDDGEISGEEAWAYVHKHFNEEYIKIHPSIFPFLLPWELTDDGNLRLRYLEYNHNSLSPSTAYEIANNISGNPLKVVGNSNDPVMSGDLRLMVTIWKKVRIQNGYNVIMCCNLLIFMSSQYYSQGEGLQQGDKRARRLHQVSVCQDNEQELAPYLPPDSVITKSSTWFKDLCDRPGKKGMRKYFETNALERKGLEQIASLIGLKSDDLKAQAVEDLYVEVLKEVVRNGPPYDLYGSAVEGFHRITAEVISLLRSTIDQTEGIVRPNTLSVKDFLSVQMDIGSNLEGINLQKILKDAYFGSQVLPVMRPMTAKVYYAKVDGLDSAEVVKYVIAASKAISDSKKLSVTRCPFAQVGNFLSNTLLNMTEEQMLFRANFEKQVYPTHPPQTAQQVTKELEKCYGDAEGHGMAKEAYPYSDFLDTRVYQAFIDDPLSVSKMNNAINLLKMKPLEDSYHVRGEEVTRLKASLKTGVVKTPDKLTFPFYASFTSMSYDVGTQLTKKSQMNPYIANNMILAPIVYTILYAANEGIPVNDCLNDEKRNKEIHYWLRFHNNFSHRSNILNLNQAYEVIYKIDSTTTPTTLADNSTYVLGATHMIVNIFMAVMALATEKTLGKPWEVRKQALMDAGHLIRNSFNRIGTTIAGRNVLDMLKLLSKY
jgi:hypothetical protein